MDKNDIDRRIIQWVMYLVENKIYKSEAEYLRTIKLGLAKLSDARKGKAGSKSVDIGIILMNDEGLNADWLMTGRGEMLLQKSDKTLHSSDASLLLRMLNKESEKIEELEKENKNLMKDKENLKDSINKLNLENSSLKQQLGIEISPSIKDAI